MNSTDKTLTLKSETAAVEPRKQVRASAGRMAMFTALRHRNFRLYWIALVSSILASVVRLTLLYIWRFSSESAPQERSIQILEGFGCDCLDSL